MFIYAYALAASKRLRTPFVLNYELNDLDSFALPKFFECRKFRPKWNLAMFRLSRKFGLRLNSITMESTCPPVEEMDKERNWSQISGFMQSELYFSDSKDLVFSELRIHPEFEALFEEKYGEAFSNRPTIVIHRRKGDYKEFGNDEIGYDLVLPIEFYEKALSLIPDIGRYDVYVIGDDTSDLKAAWGDRFRFYFVSNEMIVDFQLIQNADIAILSNSSFAWWGAYLNSKPGKRILGPKNWLGFKVGREFPHSISSTGWEWVDVPWPV